MSSLIAGPRTIERPSLATSIDWNHGSSAGLVGAVLVGEAYGIFDLAKPTATPHITATASSYLDRGNVFQSNAGTGSSLARQSTPMRAVAAAAATNDAVSLGVRKDWEFVSTDNFTVLVRTTLPASLSSGQTYWIFGRSNGQTSGNATVSWALAFTNTGTGVLPFFATGSGAATTRNVTGTNIFPAAGSQFWYDIAAVGTGADLKIYINGMLQGTTTAASISVNSTSNNFFIRENSAIAQACVFSHAYVWKRSLAQDELIRLTYQPYSLFRKERYWSIADASPRVSFTNSVGITDTIATQGTLSRTLSDTVGITDTLATHLVVAPIILTDTVGITDTVATQKVTAPISFTDSVDITGVMSVTPTLLQYDTWRPVYAPDNSYLIVCRTPEGEHDTSTGLTHMTLWSFHNDGKGEKIVMDKPSTFGYTSYSHPEFSPDGTKAVLTVETSTQYRITTVDTSSWGQG